MRIVYLFVFTADSERNYSRRTESLALRMHEMNNEQFALGQYESIESISTKK